MLKNHALAWRWYKRAADGGDADAQYKVASMYRRGLGVPATTAEMLDMYERAAKQGHVEAEVELGLLYRDGGPVRPDAKKARHWLAEAAAQGSAGAVRALEEMDAALIRRRERS